MRFLSSILIISLLVHCSHKYNTYVASKPSKPKFYLEKTKVGIDIYFLRSISSQIAEGEAKTKLIQKIMENHANWFDVRLRRYLLANGVHLVNEREKADLVLETTILDMGEVRPKIFIQGLSVGLVLGFIIGEATGEPEVGLAVFIWEVIEEIIIIYLLKSFFMITTIEMKVSTPSDEVLMEKEFTSYSNEEFEETLPDFAKKLRENRVRGSLESNARDIADYLKK